jgi:hypothetical protein
MGFDSAKCDKLNALIDCISSAICEKNSDCDDVKFGTKEARRASAKIIEKLGNSSLHAQL